MPKSSSSTSASPNLPRVRKEAIKSGNNDKKGHRPFVSFIQKLYTMCNDNEIKEISWNSEGDAIKVCDSEYLCRNIFPVYFKHSCWASFTRQLNMYGFIRESGTYCYDQALIFRHPLFVRGRPDLIFSIQRRILNQEVTPINKFQKSNSDNTTTSMILNKRILNLNKEMIDLKQKARYLNSDNQKQKSIINHNQSTMNYVKNVLSQLSYTCQDIAPELNIAIQALDLSLKYNHNFDSTNNHSLSSSNTLSPLRDTGLPKLNHHLPSISQLLNGLDSSNHYYN
ncbi:winged helix DNA-binding domain-containing protein [Neoconidiobolus thromboides FSU 785]|nr:winged helix DNA-binding domain-containing protein [Neoconidiobolus thromboides FSU 785]